MAAAADIFLAYNPHPYQGGCDLALTYGRPLLPSAATCYPLSPAPAPPSRAAPPPTLPLGPAGPPQGDPPAPRPSLQQPDLFGWWYIGARWGGKGAEPWQWAADFLFGYLPRFGPGRHESHNYGNLNYAYERRAPSLPLSAAVDPWAGEVRGFREEADFPRWFRESQQWNHDQYDYEHDYQQQSVFMENGVADGLEWWPTNCGDAKDYQEQALTSINQSCAYENCGGRMHMSGVYEPNLGKVVEYHDVGYNVVCHDGYQEQLFLPPESSHGYQRQSCLESMSVSLKSMERLQSFEMDYTGNFVEQLFCQDKEDIMGFDNGSHEGTSFAEIRSFEPMWLGDATCHDFYDQQRDLRLDNELEYKKDYHGQAYSYQSSSDYDNYYKL